jgi:hypothetical protein
MHAQATRLLHGRMLNAFPPIAPHAKSLSIITKALPRGGCREQPADARSAELPASPVTNTSDVFLAAGGGWHRQAGAQAACGCVRVSRPLTGAACLHEVMCRDVRGDLRTHTQVPARQAAVLALDALVSAANAWLPLPQQVPDHTPTLVPAHLVSPNDCDLAACCHHALQDSRLAACQHVHHQLANKIWHLL